MPSPLERAQRRQKARRLTPKMLSQVSSALAVGVGDLTILSLDATDDVVDAFRKGRARACNMRRETVMRTFSEEDRYQVNTTLRDVLGQDTEDRWYLISTLSRVCGAIVVSKQQLVQHALDLTSLDQDECHAMSADTKTGLVVAYNTVETSAGVGAQFELMIWGIPARGQNIRM